MLMEDGDDDRKWDVSDEARKILESQRNKADAGTTVTAEDCGVNQVFDSKTGNQSITQK